MGGDSGGGYICLKLRNIAVASKDEKSVLQSSHAVFVFIIRDRHAVLHVGDVAEPGPVLVLVRHGRAPLLVGARHSFEGYGLALAVPLPQLVESAQDDDHQGGEGHDDAKALDSFGEDILLL